ncbi:MAG TPA: acylphosphatase [Gemmatimonadaceae bacterium]|nr:acylphosphatase [Gemmatimonadaceae bacterium]
MHVQIAGTVQGVGFRWFARAAARRLQLSGWVKNRADGSVEVAASGRQEQLDEFRQVLERGPDGAVVSEITDLEPVAEDLDFPFSMRR